MQRSKIVELACAIRMTCLKAQEVTERSTVFVSCEDSEKACELSNDNLKDVVEQKGLKPAVVFAANSNAGQIIAGIDTIISTGRQNPKIIGIQNEGLFFIGSSMHEIDQYKAKLLGSKATEEQIHEKTGLRLDGKIAVVTGSAQGFGKGIAEELARAGAHVVISDLNEERGNQTRNAINDAYGANTSIFCNMDVTDSESIHDAIYQTVRTFGGVDIFVSNAGILKAGGIHELDLESFELVTKVNYTAFFLCTKVVSTIFKLQNAYNQDHFMDIVQINSKSGLEGSNRNFAYAGGKFGGIGLVQSFALELVVHNIKVNAICPGNFFDGPLWSDPDRGLFVQYLKAGKVPGAKTIEEVKEFYTSKVPMKRGCFPADVTKAIMYVHEQNYETGQAIPVTGGQVMLK